MNIGAAGTFVVWKPGSKARLRAELLRKLPFEAGVAVCDARDIIRLASDNPFGTKPSGSDIVRFVSVLTKTSGARPAFPIAFPSDGDWLVRLIECRDKFIFGEYRRHMKTIGYLGQIDRLFGSNVTTRNWNTIMAIVSVLTKESARDRALSR
jgi:uncharacterized protein (DUF1697 family)